MTSFGYMGQPTSAWNNSSFGKFRCMALCEIINDSNSFNKHDWGYVITDEKIIVTRYLLVFTGNSSITNTLASNLKIPKHLYQ
jgi:hypothetical protein